MKTIKLVVSLLGVSVLVSACSSTGWYKQQSAGQMGCPEDDIEISNVSQGITTKTWMASCRGHKFYCSSTTTSAFGKTSSCKEELSQK